MKITRLALAKQIRRERHITRHDASMRFMLPQDKNFVSTIRAINHLQACNP